MATNSQSQALNNVMTSFGAGTTASPEQQKALAAVFAAFGGGTPQPSAPSTSYPVSSSTATVGSSPLPTYTPSPTVPQEDPFLTQIKQELINAQGISSSADAEYKTLMNQAIETTKSGAEAGAAAVTTQYDRLKGYQSEENARAMEAAVETQRGFATNTALLTTIKETGERSINDLEQRKQELIMSGNANAASKISDLQVKTAEAMMENRQKVFSNLISMAGVGIQASSLGIQRAQVEQSKYQFDVQQRNQLGEIALQYGVEMNPGDTYEAVIARAYPKASEFQKLALDEARLGIKLKESEIALNRVQAGKISAETGGMGDLSTIAEMLKIYGTDSTFGKLLLDSAVKGNNIPEVAKLLNDAQQPQKYSDSTLRQKAAYGYASGMTIGDFIESIKSDTSVANKDRAEEIARMYYNQPKTSYSFGLSDAVKSSFKSYGSAGASAVGGPVGGFLFNQITQ